MIIKNLKILLSSLLIFGIIISIHKLPKVFANEIRSTTTLTVIPDEQTPPDPGPIDPIPEPEKPTNPESPDNDGNNGNQNRPGLIPQTGEYSTQTLSLVGVLMVAMASISLLFLTQRKEK